MLKEILEICGVVLALVLSVIAVIKYTSALKTAKEFSADLGKVYDRMREVELKVAKTVTDCQTSHGDFNKDVGLHLKDMKIHRDSELETFRYDTLSKAIAELKGDLTGSIGKVETSLCSRIESLENTVRNGANGTK